MTIGMPTLIEFKDIKENIDFTIGDELDFIELNMNLPYCLNIKEKELLKYSFNFTMHISEELNIGELNDSLREKYLEEIKRQINLGISNNIKKYTIHSNQGIYFTLPDEKCYLNNQYEELYLHNIEKSLIELNIIARDNNLEINFEILKLLNLLLKQLT